MFMELPFPVFRITPPRIRGAVTGFQSANGYAGCAEPIQSLSKALACNVLAAKWDQRHSYDLLGKQKEFRLVL